MMERVSLVTLDVDGTLTDGSLHYGSAGDEHKSFHTADGLGIVMAMSVGLAVAVISGRRSVTVERRMAELHVTELIQGCGDKAVALQSLMKQFALEAEQVAYIGDDINDLPAFDVAGVRIAVADAADLVRARADYVTQRPGGRGAVRDAIEEILKAGRLEPPFNPTWQLRRANAPKAASKSAEKVPAPVRYKVLITLK